MNRRRTHTGPRPAGRCRRRAHVVLALLLLGLLGKPAVVSDLRGALAPARALAQAAKPAVRFEAVDVFVDPHGQPLAAYQVELGVRRGDVQIVGVEGGAHPAFRAAPYYDEAALTRDRIIIAALHTGSGLPAGVTLPEGRTRVARIHLRVAGDAAPEYDVSLMVAGTSDGSPLDVAVEVGKEE